MPENWLQVPGFPAYDVSDCGRLRSYWARGGGESFNWHIAETPQRIMKLRAGHNSYLYTILRQNEIRWTAKLHRLVLTVFVGPCPDGLVCCHNDGNAQNNHLNNLRWDTLSANYQDMLRHGTWRPSGRRLLTPAQAADLRTDRANGLTYRQLSEKWGLARMSLFHICVGDAYKDCPGPITPRIAHELT